MNTRPDSGRAGPSVGRFLLETLLVFVATVVPIALLPGHFGILVAAGVIFFFLRRRGASAGPRAATVEPDPELAAFRLWRGVATLLAFLALSICPIAVWILWAFPSIADGVTAPHWVSLATAIWGTAGLLLGSALCVWIAVANLCRGAESVGQAYRRVIVGRTWLALRPVVTQLALSFGMMGLVALFASLPALIRLFEPITRHSRLPDWLEMAIAIPTVPIWLYASIVLLALHQQLGLVESAQGEPGTELQGARNRGQGLAGAAVVASALIMFSLGHVIHIGVFAALGPVAEFGPITAVTVELEDWVEGQREKGRPGNEIVAALREHGRWAPSSPEAGLVELMPALKTGKSYDTIDGSTCRFSIDAGLADAGDLRGVDWLPGDEAARPVRYCIAVACPSPTRWSDQPTLSLSSSHSSRNRYWMVNTFVDLFARGPAEPGGYCTITGAVADRFQG